MLNDACPHNEVICLNEYELIRKYCCKACGEIMMCSCDEHRGKMFLPHQLDKAVVLETQERVPVTLGFQERICCECRGLPPLSAPLAAIPGRTTKIKRFYWREIAFREFDILEAITAEGRAGELEDDELQNQVSEQALSEIKALHERSKKYDMTTESEADFIDRLKVEVVSKHAQALPGGQVLRKDGSYGRPEEFVADLLTDAGYTPILCESRPFHTLFAVLLHPLIQDASDELIQNVMFGDRELFEQGKNGMISTLLPKDFGTRGYAQRRAAAISSYFDSHLQGQTGHLLRTFDSLLDESIDLRQYLWVHKASEVDKARQLLSVIPADFVRRALEFLLRDYWHHYLGWPDIFAWQEGRFVFVEVKLSGDKLSSEQRTWIQANNDYLLFPFKIWKIHKLKTP